jgi:3'-5' exonuclease
MLENINPEKVLFLDIETVPMTPDFQSMPGVFQPLWEKKSSYFRKENETPSDVFARAGIYAEFGKIICISVGFIYLKNGARFLKLKSFYNKDEKMLLTEFSSFLDKNNAFTLCAHNGKEFDFPYLSRRMLINGIKVPYVLDASGKKPWETNFIDTMELWKFGDFKNYTSLDLLATLFGITSSKDDIDGSMVAEVFWKIDDLPRIVKYCEKDVTVIAQLLLRYKLEPGILPENIESITA